MTRPGKWQLEIARNRPAGRDFRWIHLAIAAFGSYSRPPLNARPPVSVGQSFGSTPAAMWSWPASFICHVNTGTTRATISP